MESIHLIRTSPPLGMYLRTFSFYLGGEHRKEEWVTEQTENENAIATIEKLAN